MHNYKLNPMKLSNFKQYLNLAIWGLKTSFWQLWEQDLSLEP